MPIISTLMPIIVADRPPRTPSAAHHTRAPPVRRPAASRACVVRRTRAEERCCVRTGACSAWAPRSLDRLSSSLTAIVSTLMPTISTLTAIVSTLMPTISTLMAIISTLMPITSALTAVISTVTPLIRTVTASVRGTSASAMPQSAPQHGRRRRRATPTLLADPMSGGAAQSQSGSGYARPGPFQARLWKATLLVIGARRAGAQQRPAAPGSVIDRCPQNVRAIPRNVVSRDVVSHGSIGHCLPNATAP
jgi:hypothetical protein